MMEDIAANPIWHPFTQMKTANPPIHIDRAEGSILFAKDGKEYIDAISSWWVNIHGHANPFIAKAIAEQALKLEQVIFAGFTHAPAIDLANNLLKILPDSITKIFYSDNGSTAVEVAIKMALQYWHNQGVHHKTKLIAFENGYHGDTFGAMSVGAKSTFNAAFEKHLFQVEYIPTPHENNFEAVKEQLKILLKNEDVAAFIFEPLVQGASGMLMHNPEHLDALIQLTKQHNVLCIADEVMTGFGRTGKNFATDYLQNKPDIICLSKGITGGFMPLGVTASSQKIYDAFYADAKEKTFYHGHSYTANPLACAAANASLQLLLSDDCQSQIKNIISQHTAFAASQQHESFIKEIRQTGTILAIELNTAEGSSYFNTIRHEVYDFCIENGVLLRPLGNAVYIMPPYCVTSAELNKIYQVIKSLINTFKEKYASPH
ncbi:MAG: adenosylmethionine--8-amino-7-oxononanoate transaminase [Bacteroidetes bacterium]|nr:adenosylmethionine--8-amino-7-oxononanoate transaminase [Bacteroidota bacterium]